MAVSALGTLDPLIGRTADLGRTLDLIAENRLVTLTGPGGSGKTRLAAAILQELASGGTRAAFVDLSTVEPTGAIEPAILATLQLDTSSPSPLDAIADAVRGDAVVLLLDNVEHLAEAGDLVGRLLAAAPDIRVVATSRRPLHIPGEVEFMVLPLNLPETDDVASVESSAAGSLFLARARSVGRMGTIDDATAGDVAALVRRLDGLPLALELAAARSRIASPHELLARLDTHGLSTVDSASDRRRSLAAILDWTVRLLEEDERRLLDSLAVCAGFDLGLAQALEPDRDVLGPLDELVELGLVQPAGTLQGSTRFRLLETVRGEVLRRVEPTALAQNRRRHADAVFDAVSERPSEVDDAAWVERLDVEAGNIQRALDLFVAEDVTRALQLWARLESFWATRGRIFEGMERFERLAATAPDPSPALAEASGLYVSLLSGLRGNLAAADANRRALEIARAIGDVSSEVHALDVIAINARDVGDQAAAADVLDALDRLESHIERPMDRLYASQARYFVAAALHGDLSDEALAALVVSTDLSVSAGRHDSSIVSLGNFALCRLWRNEPNEAVGPARQATDLATAVDHRYRTWSC